MTCTVYKNVTTGLLPRAGALFSFAALVVMLAAPAAAQDRDTRTLNNRINQLEKEIQTLNRTVYRGAPPPAQGAGADPAVSPAALGLFEDRLRQLEEQQRRTISQLEEVSFNLRQVQEQMQRLQSDTDARLQAVSSGAAPAQSADRPLPQPAPAAPSAESVDDAVRASTATPGVLGTLGGSAGGDTPEGLYESAFADVREQRFDVAQRKLEEFMKRYPSHQLAANAQYWLAETHYVRGDYRQAARLFAKGYQDFPEGQKAPDCLLKLGLSLARLGKKEDACLSLQQLQKEFPGDSSPVNRRAQQEMTQLGCG